MKITIYMKLTHTHTCDIDSSHTYIENTQPDIQRTYKPG